MLMDTYHSDSFWAEFGSRCLNCTACAAVCPTCMCFDIKDILSPDAKTWASVCARGTAATSPSFRPRCRRAITSRADERGRVRHRMYHKLNGFKVNHGSMLCVGCGPLCECLQGEHQSH